jgi:hypothetical protein
LGDPTPQEALARGEEMPPVVGGKLGEGHRCQRNDLFDNVLLGVRLEAMAGAPMRGPIAEPRIFLDHVLDAIEASIAVADILQTSLGQG